MLIMRVVGVVLLVSGAVYLGVRIAAAKIRIAEEMMTGKRSSGSRVVKPHTKPGRDRRRG